MKSKTLVAATCFLIFSVFAILPVYANRIVYRANGTIDKYAPWYTDAIVFNGNWRIEIAQDGRIGFEVNWLEKNINEENPGTLDKFKLVLVDGTISSSDWADVEITGTINMYKIGFDSTSIQGPPPGKAYFWLRVFPESTISITATEIEIILGGPPLLGSTISVKY